MSEKRSELDTIVNEAFGLLYEATLRRDEAMVTPEVMRVAKALCHANGGAVDLLVLCRPMPNQPNGTDNYRIFLSNVCMAWVPYVGQATCAIANLERHREEEVMNTLRHDQHTKAYDNETTGAGPDLKGFDIPGFSNMNNGEDVKIVAIDPTNPNRHTDSLSHSDLAAMVEFLATVFDEGPDGDSAICRQTGNLFDTIALAMPWDHVDLRRDEMARRTLIADATVRIIALAKDGQHTLYWRKRPEIEMGKDKLPKIYARVAFGP